MARPNLGSLHAEWVSKETILALLKTSVGKKKQRRQVKKGKTE